MTGKYKYPYVPQEYYPAVMFACKMIRENGFFNKAIGQASSYYNVDYEILEKHVRARQAAGRKGKKRGKYGKYKYYTVFQVVETGEGSVRGVEYGKVVKALNKTNARKNNEFYSYIDGEGYYARDVFPIVKGEYATKKEAEQNFESDWNKTEH